MTKAIVLSLFALICAAVSGCNSSDAPALRTVDVKLGDRVFTLEVADNDETRRNGLMHRRSMPENHGMLFVFEYSQVLGFWMKNTHIPLDILYLDKTGRIVTIRQMKPLDETTTSSERSVRFAIELNAGMAEKAGVKEGDRVSLPGYTDQ